MVTLFLKNFGNIFLYIMFQNLVRCPMSFVFQLPSSGHCGCPLLLLRLLSFLRALLLLAVRSASHSISMGWSSSRMVGTVSPRPGEARPASALLLLLRGLMGSVEDGLSLWGLEPGSFTVLFTVGLDDLCSGLLSIVCSLCGHNGVSLCERTVTKSTQLG